MSRRELNETIQEIKDYFNAENYGQVVQCAEKINLKKVREARVLDIIGTSYEQCGENDKALELFSFIYEKYGASRQMAFKLCELSVKKGDLDGAVEYYNDFCRIAPHDNARFLLKYEIGKAGNIERRELIKVLESYVSKEKDEKWEYELAKMYHEAGLESNCVKLCDDIFTWFADGEYVKKALELKFAHKALTPEQQNKYEEMMEQRIILDNPGRYVINGTEEAFETSSHIETFEASNEKTPAKEEASDDYDDTDEISNTLVMSAEAVNREIDRADDAPRITRYGAEPEPEDDEPLDEEMTLSLTEAIAANTRETEKAAILEAVLKAQELAAEGKNENNLFYAMEEAAGKKPAEAPNAQTAADESGYIVSGTESPADEVLEINAVDLGVVKLDPVQALKLGTAELRVSSLTAYVSKPDLRTELPVRQGKADYQPEKAVVLTSEEEQNDEIWLDSEVLFVPQPEDEVQDEDNLPDEYNDEETWEETPGPGPKLTKMADVSNIPMESSVDGQIGINLDMLTDDSEGIEGQMTIDEVFEQYAQKVKENESKYAEIEAERLRQIQEAVSGMVPTPLYEIEDEPEPDSPTKDVTMNVTELFSSGKAIEQMLKTAEDDEAKPIPEEYNDEDLSAIREVNIEEEINKRNAEKAVSNAGIPEEAIPEAVIPEAGVPGEGHFEAKVPETGIFAEEIPESAVQEEPEQAVDELKEDNVISDAEAEILEAVEAGLRAVVEAEISAVKAEMSESSQPEPPAAEEQPAEQTTAGQKEAADQTVDTAADMSEKDDSDAELEELLAMLSSMEEEKISDTDDTLDMESALAEAFAKEIDFELEKNTEEESPEDEFGKLFFEFENEKNKEEDLSEDNGDLAAILAGQIDTMLKNSFGQQEEENAEEQLAAEKAAAEKEAAERAAAEKAAAERAAAERAAAEKAAAERAAAERAAAEKAAAEKAAAEKAAAEKEAAERAAAEKAAAERAAAERAAAEKAAAERAAAEKAAAERAAAERAAAEKEAAEKAAAEKAAAERAAAEKIAVAEATAMEAPAPAPTADDFDALLAAFDAGSEEDDEDIPDFENVGAIIESKLAEESIKTEAETEAEKFIKEMQEEAEAEKTDETQETGNTIRLSGIDEIMAALLGETAAPETEEESDAAAEETEEIPADLKEKPVREDGFELSDDLRNDLEEFLFIDGMEEAICDAVVGIAERKRGGDVTGGNLIITGDSKTGKTYLAVNIIKAVTGEIGGGVEKVAKVQAQALNGKNIDKVFEKIGASDLIIENVGFLGDETILEIITSIKEGKPEGMVVMEGNQLAVENIFYTFPEAKELFQARVDINELNIVQWSELACKYAETRGYIIDDMAQLALHARINEINLPTVRLGYGDITKIVDSAIQKADKRNVGKIFSAFSHKHGDGMKEIIEADFE